MPSAAKPIAQEERWNQTLDRLVASWSELLEMLGVPATNAGTQFACEAIEHSLRTRLIDHGQMNAYGLMHTLSHASLAMEKETSTQDQAPFLEDLQTLRAAVSLNRWEDIKAVRAVMQKRLEAARGMENATATKKPPKGGVCDGDDESGRQAPAR